jgi:hypothetical protein
MLSGGWSAGWDVYTTCCVEVEVCSRERLVFCFFSFHFFSRHAILHYYFPFPILLISHHLFPISFFFFTPFFSFYPHKHIYTHTGTPTHRAVSNTLMRWSFLCYNRTCPARQSTQRHLTWPHSYRLRHMHDKHHDQHKADIPIHILTHGPRHVYTHARRTTLLHHGVVLVCRTVLHPLPVVCVAASVSVTLSPFTRHVEVHRCV